MATLKSSQIRNQFIRFQSLIYIVFIAGLGLYIGLDLVPKLQDYLMKINTKPVDMQIAEQSLELTNLSNEANAKQGQIDLLAEGYKARLNAKAPKVIDYYKLVRYFDHLGVKYGSPGQIFEVDSVTISEVQSSIPKKSRGKSSAATKKAAATTASTSSHDYVTVQIPMRVSELNLKRFINEIYDTKNIVTFLEDNSTLDDEYIPPLMRLEQLTVTPETVDNKPGSAVSYYTATATVSVYFQPFTADDVKETLKGITPTNDRLKTLVQGTEFEEQYRSANALLSEAATLMDSDPRDAQVKAKSAQLILADIDSALGTTAKTTSTTTPAREQR